MPQELEYDKAEEENDKKRMEEIKDAIYYLQRLHADKLSEMITDYRPNGQPNQWGNDPEYMAMLEGIKRMNGNGNSNSNGGGGGKKRGGPRKKKNIEAAKKAAAAVPDSIDEFDANMADIEAEIRSAADAADATASAVDGDDAYVHRTQNEVITAPLHLSYAQENPQRTADVHDAPSVGEVASVSEADAVSNANDTTEKAAAEAEAEGDEYGDGDDFEDDFEEL